MFTFVAKAIERSLKNIKSAHIFSFWQCNITKEVGNEVTPDYKTLDMCWETVQICFDPPLIMCRATGHRKQCGFCVYHLCPENEIGIHIFH